MSHNDQTLFASKGNVQIPSVQTTSNEKKDFVYMVLRTFHDTNTEMKGVMLKTFSLDKLKSLPIVYYLNMHEKS